MYPKKFHLLYFFTYNYSWNLLRGTSETHNTANFTHSSVLIIEAELNAERIPSDVELTGELSFALFILVVSLIEKHLTYVPKNKT